MELKSSRRAVCPMSSNPRNSTILWAKTSCSASDGGSSTSALKMWLRYGRRSPVKFPTLCSSSQVMLDLDHGVGCSTTVSYTHLRAHETVLDLVCRLLLEKK